MMPFLKPVLAIAAGFFIATFVFISGAAVAMHMFMAKTGSEPETGEQVAALWSPNPNATDTRIISARTHFDEGYAGEPETQTASGGTGNAADAPEQEADLVRTASLGISGAEGTVPLPETETTEPAFSQAHVQWCFDKYRSYRPETNSYTPYSGGSKPCVSPYMEETEQYASNETANGLPASHVSECMNRYRSYRVSDNSYQPYGGGPREQCVID